MFHGWLEAQGMSTTLNAIGETDVRGFILHVQARPGLKGVISPNTVKNRVRALRVLRLVEPQGIHRGSRAQGPQASQDGDWSGTRLAKITLAIEMCRRSAIMGHF